MQESTHNWEWEIGPKPDSSVSVFKSVFGYRHLLTALVRKDFLLNYQQTILGPLWIFFQPILTLIIYVLVFGRLVRIPTGDTIPPVLFYFSGIVLWSFFSDAFGGISNVFREHAHLYSKVYFPRIIIPLSILTTNFLRFLIQLALLVVLIVHYVVFRNFHLTTGWTLLSLLAIFLGIGIISMGCGLIAALLTAKYRDMVNLIGIVLRLLMFVTPVLYPLSAVTDKLKWVAQINPLTSLFEWFRLATLGEGTVDTWSLVYSFGFGITVLVIGFILFNARSSKLIDVS
jgi:lipopolysaccharide transport system permease protein